MFETVIAALSDVTLEYGSLRKLRGHRLLMGAPIEGVGQVPLGTFTAAKVMARDFDRISLGDITLTLRIQCHLVVERGAARASARSGQISSDHPKQEKTQQDEKKQTQQQAPALRGQKPDESS
jgi:hypothetical protein